MATTTRGKSFSWSYSKIKNYRTCPRRHLEIDIAKNYTDSSDALTWGNEIHDALAARLGPKKVPLKPEHADYEEWATAFDTGVGVLLVEQKLAIDADFQPCRDRAGGPDFFSRKAWFRGVLDVIRLIDPVNGKHMDEPKIAHIADWKTGKILEDSVQLALFAACAFAFWPTLQRVRTDFIWLKDDAVTQERFDRADMPAFWTGMMPEVRAYQQACETQTFPPVPGRLCRSFCPVSSCPHHGKG